MRQARADLIRGDGTMTDSTQPSVAAPLRFVQTRRADAGFSACITYLAARDPFRAMPLGHVSDTVAGAVRRGHYILALDGGRVVGVTLWALADAAVAERWFAGGAWPSFAETQDGDTVILMLGGGEHPRVALQGVRHIAGLYPGRPYLMTRFGRDRTSRGRFPARAGAVSAPSPP